MPTRDELNLTGGTSYTANKAAKDAAAQRKVPDNGRERMRLSEELAAELGQVEKTDQGLIVPKGAAKGHRKNDKR